MSPSTVSALFCGSKLQSQALEDEGVKYLKERTGWSQCLAPWPWALRIHTLPPNQQHRNNLGPCQKRRISCPTPAWLNDSLRFMRPPRRSCAHLGLRSTALKMWKVAPLAVKTLGRWRRCGSAERAWQGPASWVLNKCYPLSGRVWPLVSCMKTDKYPVSLGCTFPYTQEWEWIAINLKILSVLKF